MQLSKFDTLKYVSTFGKSSLQLLWEDQGFHYNHLYGIDPYLVFRASFVLSRAQETVLHRVRLNVDYTRAYLFENGQCDCPLCVGCQIPENVPYVLWECQLYGLERSNLQLDIRINPPNIRIIKDFLGPWASCKLAQSSTRALLTFLRNTRFLDIL